MADEKISAMPTLSNPPAGSVYLAGIVNDGTTTTNVQVPQGIIVQPQATGTNSGLGILLQAGLPGPGGYGNYGIYIQGPTVTQAGTSDTAGSTTFQFYTGAVTVTNPGGVGLSGAAIISSGVVREGTSAATGAEVFVAGATLGPGYAFGASLAFNAGSAYGATNSVGGSMGFNAGDGDQGGGGVNISGGNSTLGGGGQGVIVAGTGYSHGGNQIIQAGNASGPSGVAGNLVLEAGYGNTNGSVIVQPAPTTDPHVLNALWRDPITNGATFSQG